LEADDGASGSSDVEFGDEAIGGYVEGEGAGRGSLVEKAVEGAGGLGGVVVEGGEVVAAPPSPCDRRWGLVGEVDPPGRGGDDDGVAVDVVPGDDDTDRPSGAPPGELEQGEGSQQT